MPIVFKYVTRPDDPRPPSSVPMPLGLLTQVEDEDYPDLMIGTNCANPATLNAYANWHFRVENVPASYIAADVYPRQIDGPVPQTYGTWLHTDHIPCREDCACSEVGNWPLYFVQTQNADGTYTWDIFIVPYLGGSYTPGVEPKLPLPNTQYQLELYDSYNEQTYTTITSELIPELSPIFGPMRSTYSNADLYPALYGNSANYLDPRGEETHAGVDIIPKVLRSIYAPNEVGVNWDTAYPELAKVYAITAGTVYADHVSGTIYDLTLIPDSSGPFAGLAFNYVHVVPLHDPGTYPRAVTAGSQIGAVNNHANDSRAGGQSHLHLEVKIHMTSFLRDPRQFIYPGLTP